MNRIVRRRLEMAVRVRDFSRAHPSPDASYALVLSQFDGQVLRLEELAKQQQGGFLTSRASVARRRALRHRLHRELLRHLVTVAEVAARDQPGLAEQFTLPSSSATNEGFRTFARKMLEQGQAQRELLAKHGLADKLLEDLEAAVDDFDASVVESNQGRRAHVGARAELKAVSDEVMRLVSLLDGLNRYRFSGNAEMRAAWESARNVVSGPSTAEEEPAEGVAPTVEGEVRPAA
jgi:hypothetical protein